jgi:hypothetical protein
MTEKIHPTAQGGSTNNFTPIPPPAPFQAADPADLLLGIQGEGLCQISYTNYTLSRYLLSELVRSSRWFSWFRPLKKEDHEKIDAVARKSDQMNREQVNVGLDEFIAWTESVRFRGFRRRMHSQCVTGVINVAEDPTKDKDLVPFVVFRGSTVMKDFIRDARAAVDEIYVTEKGNKSDGEIALGFGEMLVALKKLKQDGKTLIEEIFRLVDKYDNGLLIAGHSLGGACASIFLLELMLDYPELLQKYGKKIRIVTFGAPRALDKESAKKVNALPITSLRFVNNDDLVTNIVPESFGKYHIGKAIYPYLSTDVTKLTSTKKPLEALPDWKTIKSKNTDNTALWMVAYDPVVPTDGRDWNFSANSVPDSGLAKKYNVPITFLTGSVNSHFIVDQLGYNRIFQNYTHVQNLDAKTQAAAKLASLFWDNSVIFSDHVKKELKV